MTEWTKQEIDGYLSQMETSDDRRPLRDFLHKLQEAGFDLSGLFPQPSTDIEVEIMFCRDTVKLAASSDASKLKDLILTGQDADWFTLNLLRYIEGTDTVVPAIWVFGVCPRSSDISRVNRLNCKIQTAIGAWLSDFGFRFECERRTLASQEGYITISTFRPTWESDARVSGPVFDAASYVDKARQFTDESKYAAALRSVIAGAECCALVFALYSLCLEILTKAPALPLTKQELTVLLCGVAAMESWLRRLMYGFNFDRIPDEYQEFVKDHCLSYLEARLNTLKRLREVLEDGNRATTVVAQNPLNPVLDHYQRIVSGTEDSLLEPDAILRPSALKIFDELVSKTQDHIRDSEKFEKLERQDFAAARQLSDEETLKAALADLLKMKSTFRFPDPGKGNPKWKEQTVILWAKAVLYPPKPRKERPRSTLERTVSKDFMVAGALTRTHGRGSSESNNKS